MNPATEKMVFLASRAIVVFLFWAGLFLLFIGDDYLPFIVRMGFAGAFGFIVTRVALDFVKENI